MIRKIPVVVRLYPDQIQKLDAIEEIKIDRHNLTKELLRQPARYLYWSSVYTEVYRKCEFLQERLDRLESRLFLKYSGNGERVSDVKHRVQCNKKFKKLKSVLRRWRGSEYQLKHIVRAFEERKDILMAINANARKNWRSGE